MKKVGHFRLAIFKLVMISALLKKKKTERKKNYNILFCYRKIHDSL